MSAANGADPASKSAAKKKKKSKKKANGKPEGGNKTTTPNGVANGHPAEADEEDDDDDTPESPLKVSVPQHIQNEDSLHMPSSPPEPVAREEEPAVRNRAQDEAEPELEVDTQAAEEAEPEGGITKHNEQSVEHVAESTDTSDRLQALQEERDNLRAEVTQLRQSLESLQEKHNEELSSVKEELAQAEQGKEAAETQHRNLLGRVNTIRSQLGERLRADQGRIEELETVNGNLKEENERLQENVSDLNARLEEQASEIESLRSRTSLSTTNWAKERDDLVSREAYIREEYEVAKQAMQDWEILATEERSRREALEERAQELEEQLSSQREMYDRVRSDAETQSSAVDGLQRALRDLQEERRKELREMVEQSQAQLEALRLQTKAAEETAADLRKELETTQAELQRALPFEKEVKEKNLQLGKARHQAVILNEHLIRALTVLKRGKPEDNVDRNVVTNYIIQYLGMERSDTKRFQVLQLLAALLGWNEEQKEKAGLLRQGFLTAGSNLSLPLSPFRRTPSTPSLSSDFVPESPAGATKESLAELWSEFLEREAESGITGGSSSRKGSGRSPSFASITSPIGGPTGRQSPDIKRKESTASGNNG